SLSGVFSDADGDALTISAALSNEATATVSVASDGSKLTVTGVAEGTATVTVTAQDTDGNTVSDVFNVTVIRAPEPEPEPVELPGPVVNLQLTATDNGVIVSWQAPESGDAPRRYIVHIRPEGGAEGSGRTKTPKAKKTKVTFDNLEAGRTYNVWVRAENEAGKGERVRAGITLPEAEPPLDQEEEGDGQQQDG
ncbi:MAG: fibronectin type III domain-containing protein, partial [Chloroflexi bacterium]|nr:fibronectin type III domain-containing protein [Chloroflexota bacterium]